MNQALRRNFDGTSKVFFRFFDRRRFDGAVNLTNEVSRESTDVRHGVLETRQDVIGIVVVWFNLQRLDEVAFDGVRELDFLSRLGEHAQACVRNARAVYALASFGASSMACVANSPAREANCLANALL